MNVEDNQIGDESQSQLLGSTLALGSEVEQLVVKFLSSLGVVQQDHAQLLMFSMSVRCLNFFRAIQYLSQEQLAQPVAACVRSLLEQRWVFEAVAHEPTREEALRRLAEHEERNRKQGLDNLRKLGQDGRDQRITDESLAEVEAGIDSERRAYHSQKKWAELAKRESEYLTTYAVLCDQLHPSLRAVEKHFLFDAGGRVQSVTAKADVHALPLHMTQACEVMIDVIAACPESWLTEDMVSQATALRQRLCELWERLPDPLFHSR